MIGSNKSEDIKRVIKHCKENKKAEKLIETGLTNITLIHTDYSDFIINIGENTKEPIEEKIENIIGKYWISSGINNTKEKMKLRYKIVIIMTFIFSIALIFLGTYYGWTKW